VRKIQTNLEDFVEQMEGVSKAIDSELQRRRKGRQSVAQRLAAAAPRVATGTHRLEQLSHYCEWNGDLQNPEIELWRDAEGNPILADFRVWLLPKAERPRCGARCRTGQPCKARVVVEADGSFAKRCRMHGGLSSGPKTSEGRAAIAESNRRRAKRV
jgi:hypothetical protein